MVLRWTIILNIDMKREVKVKWHMAKYATLTRNVCSAFNPSKCTHIVNTHPEQWAAILRRAVGGSVPCSRAPQSWYRGWRECWTFTPPTYNPCWTWDSNPWPLGCKSYSLTIRVRKRIQMFRCGLILLQARDSYISPKPDTIITNLNTRH